MLTPKRVKHRKQHRPSLAGKANKGNTVTYGDYGLQALEPAWITNRQIEAARIAINRYVKRGGKLWIKIFPDRPLTVKPAETRMEKARVLPSIGWQWLSPDGLCLSYPGLVKK